MAAKKKKKRRPKLSGPSPSYQLAAIIRITQLAMQIADLALEAKIQERDAIGLLCSAFVGARARAKAAK